MRVMCINAWGGKLHDTLIPFLASERPEVLCLQEVVHTPESDKHWLDYRDNAHLLPQRANLFKEVCKVLPDHVATFCPAAQGVLWDGDASVASQWGLATLVHKSLAVIGQVQGFVHKDYSPSGYGDHPRSRSAHGVRIYDHIHERALSVTQMHGLRDLAGKQDTEERRAQAARLLAMSQAVSAPGELRIICGDFNVLPDSDTLKLLQASGMVELVTSRSSGGTRTSHYAKSSLFADYMLISDEQAVTDFRVIRDPEVSDHCPLVVTL